MAGTGTDQGCKGQLTLQLQLDRGICYRTMEHKKTFIPITSYVTSKIKDVQLPCYKTKTRIRGDDEQTVPPQGKQQCSSSYDTSMERLVNPAQNEDTTVNSQAFFSVSWVADCTEQI